MTDYDAIYEANPKKWMSDDRDSLAFQTLEGFVGQPKTLLDIGCGNGHTLAYFSDRWPETVYCGLDVSATAIRIAEHKLPQVLFRTGDFATAALPFEPFDIILAMGVMEHIFDLESALRRVHSLMNRDSAFYLEVPNNLGDGEEGFRESGEQEEWHLTHESWEKELRKAGFAIPVALQGDRPSFEFVWIAIQE
jgi:trans-aconitate methyltransferase